MTDSDHTPHDFPLQDPVAARGGAAALDTPWEITVRVAEKYRLQAVARDLLPAHAVAECCRGVAPGAAGVEVRKLRDRAVAYFGNVIRCDSVWDCPVCASRISEERRRELRWLVGYGGFLAVLVSFTVAHRPGQALSEPLGLLKLGHDRFCGGRGWVALREKHEIAGMVTATEVTHGQNGWHPHLHALLMLRAPELDLLPAAELIRYRDQRVGLLELDLWRRWCDVVTGLGGKVDQQAFDVRATDDQVADYVAKFGRLPSELRPRSSSWGVEDELAKSNVKRARGAGSSPFELLARAGDGDELAGRLFVEYAQTMKGRRHLRFSKGLRELVGLGREKRLAELITADDRVSDVLALLTRDEWRCVVRNDARAGLLGAAASGGAAGVAAFLARLPGWDRARSDVVRVAAASAAECAAAADVLRWQLGL